MTTSRFEGDLVLRALSQEEMRKINSSVQVWELKEDLVYFSDLQGTIRVPAGFLSDFASVPRGTKWFIDDDAPEILLPSVVHDYLYSRRGWVPSGRILSRNEADAVLKEAMRCCGAGALKANVVFCAVRMVGGRHWGA